MNINRRVKHFIQSRLGSKYTNHDRGDRRRSAIWIHEYYITILLSNRLYFSTY